MTDVVNILGVNINRMGINEIACELDKMIQEGKFNSVFTPNSEIIMSAYKNKELAGILNNAALLTADGIGVVYAAKIFGKPVPERAAGYDISKKLMEIIAGK
jgi:N-acetylglucosaminyldiphosphoundecaprenol N-acetyl-beta-D-mannosaminyltransferase